ncbi:MAG TPA: hypothetical protein VKN35_09170 [Xanthomonadales bacterium]|nr:hypothetical protein [Xanthomonadales bacterium]
MKSFFTGRRMTRFMAAVGLLWVCSSGLEAQQPLQNVRDVVATVFLIDIDEIDSVNQRFIVNFFYELRWNDPSQAHPGPDSINRDLDDIWYPQVQILNEQSLVRTFPQTAEIKPDGEVIYRQRVWGSLSQPLELKVFPYDSQTLEIILVGLHFGNKSINFIASPDSALSDKLSIPDWQVLGWDFSATELPLGRNRSNLPGLVFSIDVERETAFFTLKVMIPLMLIVAMSMLVFWLDPSVTAPRISVAVTAMLTLIAYRFAIGSMVPRLPFLTSLDWFVLASSVLVFLCLVTVVYSTVLAGRGENSKALAVDRKARWIAPGLYLALVIETLFVRFGT